MKDIICNVGVILEFKGFQDLYLLKCTKDHLKTKASQIFLYFRPENCIEKTDPQVFYINGRSSNEHRIRDNTDTVIRDWNHN